MWDEFRIRQVICTCWSENQGVSIRMYCESQAGKTVNNVVLHYSSAYSKCGLSSQTDTLTFSAFFHSPCFTCCIVPISFTLSLNSPHSPSMHYGLLSIANWDPNKPVVLWVFQPGALVFSQMTAEVKDDTFHLSFEFQIVKNTVTVHVVRALLSWLF